MTLNDTQTVGTDAPLEDTAVAPTSEASEVQIDAPEATQEQAVAQETTAPETNAEDTAEAKLYAGKYKSVEEMESAYQELNSKFTNTAQEKAELTRILDQAFAAPANEPVVDTGYGYEEPLVNPEIEGLKRDNSVFKFITTHEDADASAMEQVLKSDPVISQIAGYDAKLEYAYLKSKTIAQPKAIAEAQRVAVEQTQAKTAEKQVAQVESARKAAPASDKADRIERMRYGDKSARAELVSELPAVKEMRRMAGLE
jgi:hypothetical protein